MTIELRPLGVTCNIDCAYCYQNPQRQADNRGKRYHIASMKDAILREGGPFSLFGGEPLMVPEEDLEALWSWGLATYGSNSIQTNASLINDQHIRMFHEYKVSVGISVDGPADLNAARWAGSEARTQKATQKTEKAIKRLCHEGIIPSLIVTLTRKNAAPEHLMKMGEWLHDLDKLGIKSVRLHLMESESDEIRHSLGLSDDENIQALRYYSSLNLQNINFDLFEDMRKLLRGQDSCTTCVWNACDPYTTRAVQGVEGFGQRSNCGRTNKDGIDFVKADQAGYERYLSLYRTPQEYGGCKGCRFFLMCKGNCPGTAMEGDWRYRTEHCEVWRTLFRELEEEMLDAGEVPLSAHPARTELEAYMLENWERGNNCSIEPQLGRFGIGNELQNQISPTSMNEHGDQHGDHYDS